MSSTRACQYDKDHVTDMRLPPSEGIAWLATRKCYKGGRDIFLFESMANAIMVLASDNLDGEGSLYGCQLEHSGKVVKTEEQVRELVDKTVTWWLGYGPEPVYAELTGVSG